MSFVTLLGIAFGLSMDAFAVSMSIGICTDQKWKSALYCALYFGIFQAIMPLLGWLLGVQFADLITQIDHYIAFILLGFLGGKMIYEGIRESGEETVCKTYRHKDYFILAIATSIDALAVGVTFAFLQLNIFWSIGIIGTTTFLLSFAAVYLGDIVGKFLKGKAEVFGGAILIFIGIKILIEHLMAG